MLQRILPLPSQDKTYLSVSLNSHWVIEQKWRVHAQGVSSSGHRHVGSVFDDHGYTGFNRRVGHKAALRAWRACRKGHRSGCPHPAPRQSRRWSGSTAKTHARNRQESCHRHGIRNAILMARLSTDPITDLWAAISLYEFPLCGLACYANLSRRTVSVRPSRSEPWNCWMAACAGSGVSKRTVP